MLLVQKAALPINLHDPGSMPCQGEMEGHCSWHIDEQRPRRPAERNASTPALPVFRETLSCGQDILTYLDGVQFEGGKRNALGMLSELRSGFAMLKRPRF